ncbi:hypothetical protein BJV77DRAFT_100868 [Russula vinacea]|nr:hypothetical protein BJV77DRAFT_100868 [Russula vinacea]
MKNIPPRHLSSTTLAPRPSRRHLPSTMVTNLVGFLQQAFRENADVYLVKRPVKNSFIRLAGCFGFDSNNWALRIDREERKYYYHLTTNGTRTQFLSTQKRIPRKEIAGKVKIGITRMSDEEVVREANDLLKSLREENRTYKLYAGNCQGFATRLATQIQPNDLRSVLIEGRPVTP